MKVEEERKCIVSGEVMEKIDLLRFTATPDGLIIPDFKKKFSGRGVWVKCSKTSLQTAIDKNLFSKALKRSVKAEASLVEIVEAILCKRGLEVISLARKAGVLVTGFEKVCDVIKKGKAAFILEAK